MFAPSRREVAVKAWKTIRVKKAWIAAHAAEAASKVALQQYCHNKGWDVAFFEGKTGAPRTGIIDAIAFRLARGKADKLEVRLIQLKGGKAGLTGREIGRLKEATAAVNVRWLIAAFDGETLQYIPDDL